jgi:molecular chaperone GrpE
LQSDDRKGCETRLSYEARRPNTMTTDDPEDSLREIEAYLSGDVNPAEAEPEVPGFDDMLKSALDTATTAAPAVEDNDAWLDAILAETEEESGAAVSALYGDAESAPAQGSTASTPRPAAPMEAPSPASAPTASAPTGPRAAKAAEDSLEDAVAAALRSVSMPAVGVSIPEPKRPPAILKRQARPAVPTRRIELPRSTVPAPQSTPAGGAPAVPAKPPEVEESAKVKELREQVQQFGRETEKYRERMEDQARQARTKGRKDVFDRLLPILDTLDIAIQSAPSAKSADKVIAGVEMVFGQLLTELSRLGLECINPVGETFDPALHEAMQKSQTGTVETGQINKVLRRGFVMNEKLVRAAQVIVEV